MRKKIVAKSRKKLHLRCLNTLLSSKILRWKTFLQKELTGFKKVHTVLLWIQNSADPSKEFQVHKLKGYLFSSSEDYTDKVLLFILENNYTYLFRFRQHKQDSSKWYQIKRRWYYYIKRSSACSYCSWC